MRFNGRARHPPTVNKIRLTEREREILAPWPRGPYSPDGPVGNPSADEAPAGGRQRERIRWSMSNATTKGDGDGKNEW